MQFPKVEQSYVQERRGVAAVQSFAARHGQVFRETPTGDVGIDGQLEFVDSDGSATGRTLAIQIKSGPSFFEHPTEHGWKFYPKAKHRTYWEFHPFPVILILHDPASDHSYWVDARQALRTPSTDGQAFVEVLAENELSRTAVTRLFESAGALAERFTADLNVVLDALIDTRTESGSFPLSFLDLFCGGLTNICRSIYFGIDVAIAVVESNLEMIGSEIGWGVGHAEHEFLFSFVRFLVAQNLADVNLSDCLIDVVDRELTPTFVAPLTSRGRALVALIHSKERELVRDGNLSDGDGCHVAQEAFVEIVATSYSGRLPRFYEFQVALRPNSG